MFLIIHNPLSSNKRSRHKTKRIVRLFKKTKTPFIIRSGLKIENLMDYLNHHQNITDILLLGGDGSINYFINSVDVQNIKQNIYLAKSGSGNDFLRSLKPLKKADVTLGVAKVNQTKDIHFINGCGLGFDGLVCYYVDNDHKKNKISYFINVFRSIIHYQPQTFKLTIDGKEYIYKKAHIASIQNGRYFGGGMKAAPKANIEDDAFTVIVVHGLKKWLLQILLLTIYPGWHRYIKKYVHLLTGKDIQIQTEEPTYFQFDGEVESDIQTIQVQAKSKRTFHAFHKNSIK
jgi:diacylglycerol kinase family enzyme